MTGPVLPLFLLAAALALRAFQLVGHRVRPGVRAALGWTAAAVVDLEVTPHLLAGPVWARVALALPCVTAALLLIAFALAALVKLIPPGGPSGGLPAGGPR